MHHSQLHARKESKRLECLKNNQPKDFTAINLFRTDWKTMHRDKKKKTKKKQQNIRHKLILQCVNLLMRKMNDMPSILSLFRNEFNKINNTRARMLDDIKITLTENVIIMSLQ